MPTADAYFAAAQELMADGDPSRVTIDALCQRVGTTSGSYYHHFGSHDGFVQALAKDWGDRVTTGLEAATPHTSDLAATRRLINQQILRQPHKQEAAFRAWARTNPAIRAAVERVDTVRAQVSRDMVSALAPGLDSKTITSYAEIASLVLIGAQAHDPNTAADVGARSLAAFASLIERADAPSGSGS